MADNVPITAGTGTNIATDDISGVHYQRVKVTYGADGTATDVTTTNRLPVESAGNVASGATDSGNPIKIGGKVYTPASNIPALTNGQRSDMVLNTYGAQYVQLSGAFQNPIDTVAVNVDTNAGGGNTLPVGAFSLGFNDTSAQWKRLRAESNGVLTVKQATENGATFRGRASTHRMVGRAGTSARRLLSIWNPSGTGKVVVVNQIALDFAQTAAIAVTVIPPVIRVYRVTTAPFNGTALTKVTKDSALAGSHASIVLLQDASADGTNSPSALTATTTVGTALTQEFFPRLITAAGYEVADRIELLHEKEIILRPGEGLVVSSDITLATQEPAGVHSIATIDWYEV